MVVMVDKFAPEVSILRITDDAKRFIYELAVKISLGEYLVKVIEADTGKVLEFARTEILSDALRVLADMIDQRS